MDIADGIRSKLGAAWTPAEIPLTTVWRNPGVGWGSSCDLTSARGQALEMMALHLGAAQFGSWEATMTDDEVSWLISRGARVVEEPRVLRQTARLVA